MNKSRNRQLEVDVLLLSRGGQVFLGLPLLFFGVWGLWSCAQFLDGAKQFEAIEWVVFLVFNELFAGVTFAAVTLLICAAFNPPWLRSVLQQAIHHLHWMLAAIGICAIGGALLLLLAIPVILLLDIVRMVA